MIFGTSPYFAFIGLSFVLYVVSWLIHAAAYTRSRYPFLEGIFNIVFVLASMLLAIQIFVWGVGVFKMLWGML